MTGLFKDFAAALWFFLPAVMANQMPGWTAALLRLIGKPEWNIPVEVELFGSHKTWQAYLSAPLGAIMMIYLQRSQWAASINASIGLINYSREDLWFIGLLFGLGVVFGDHGGSFIKRRLGIAPGEPWIPFDWLSYIPGVFLVVGPYLDLGFIPGLTRLSLIGLAALVLHAPVKFLGYLLGVHTEMKV